MDSLKQSIAELTVNFNTRMAMDFQKDLAIASTPASSPTSNITAQFCTFRTFVLGALESLQAQVQFLSKQCDDMDMRTRRKILLFHGICEDDSVDLLSTVCSVLTDHLKLPEVTADSIRRCQRLGSPNTKKPRALLVKFQDITVKNKVWFAKNKLKGTGITISEFLTKSRHDTFLMARQRLGITKCWTRDGIIVFIAPDGSQHRVTTSAELEKILNASSPPAPSTSASGPSLSKDIKAPTVRTKRVIKK